MAVNRTIVSIDDTKNKIQQLYTFINEHFNAYQIDRRTLFVEYSLENHHKHVFLLKWVYALYTKVHRKDDYKLRDALLNRIDKPIELMTKKEIVTLHSIMIHKNDSNLLTMTISPNNYHLISQLHQIFRHSILKISYMKSSLIIDAAHSNTLELLRNILQLEECAGVKISFVYDQLDMNNLLNQESNADEIYINALFNLKSTPFEDLAIIKKRYRKLLREFHPDNVFHEGEEKINQYTTIFQNLQYSFSIVENRASF